MPRSSFGGSQDLSQVFASFYAEYAGRLETNALRLSRDAEEAQAATDNDTIDRWQQGELSDEEFLAYAAERVAATGDDPERNAYWKRVQRDTEKSILTEQVSDTAEDLVNQIEAGTKTWADLLAYYKEAQKSLRPNDPLFKDLEKQIEQVNDRIRDNQIAAGFERVQYEFEANQLSGKDAGAQLRQMAEVYRVNDPAKYYQILQQALSLEKFAGFYSAGSGSGGSGRGSSAKPLNQLIDALQGMEDRIGSLSEQFEDGVRVGAITVENEDGTLSTEEVLLRNEDGTPSSSMESLDSQMLETLDRLEQAYIQKGDRSAAGETANRRMQYVTDHVQPRNTIGPDQQAAAILQVGLSLVEQAAESDDPVLAWGKVQVWARDVGEWGVRVNNTVTRKRQPIPEGVDDTTRFRTTATADAIEAQTTAEFADQITGLTAFAAALANGDAAGASAAFDGFSTAQKAPGSALREVAGDPSSSNVVRRVTAAIDLVTGIPAGRYVRAYVPGEGLVYAPVVRTFSTEIGPDGRATTGMISVPVNAKGEPIYDASRGEQLVKVMVEVDGRAQMVEAVSQPTFFAGGRSISASEYQSALKAYQAATPAEQAGLPELQEYRAVLIPGADGQRPQNWIYDSKREMWFKNKVTKTGGVPLPFVGNNARLAQQVADKLGIDPKGSSYYNLRAEAQYGPRTPGGASDWYSQSQANARAAASRLAREQTANEFRAGRDLLGGAAKIPGISAALRKMGEQLGVRSFDSPTVSTPLPRLGGLQETIDFQAPPTPKITLPKITLPPLRRTLASEPLATTTTTRPRTSGFTEGYT